MNSQKYAEERAALWLRAHPRFLSNEAEQDLIVELRAAWNAGWEHGRRSVYSEALPGLGETDWRKRKEALTASAKAEGAGETGT